MSDSPATPQEGVVEVAREAGSSQHEPSHEPSRTDASECARHAPSASRIASSARWLRQHGLRVRGVGTILVPLVVIWIALTFASPYFLTQANITNILLNTAPLAFVAAGMTLTLVAAEIDLAVGSTVALTGSLMALLMKNQGVPWPLAVVAGLTLGVVIGFVSGWFVTRIGMPSFVATLAMLGIARGSALILTGGEAIADLPAGFGWLGRGRLASVPFPVILAILVYIVLHFVASRTRLGLNIYAVGGNAEAARLAGVDIRRVKMAVLILSGFMSAIAGVILAARLNAGSGVVGEDLLLDAIAAVVIGGTSFVGGVGTLLGTAIGALLTASLRNGLVLLNVTAFWQKVAIGLLILLAVSIDHFAKRRSA